MALVTWLMLPEEKEQRGKKYKTGKAISIPFNRSRRVNLPNNDKTMNINMYTIIKEDRRKTGE